MSTRHVRAGLALAIALAMAPGAAAAQSPEPSVAPSAAAAAACDDLASLLPGEVGDGLALEAEVGEGVDGFDPDDMLDPFLASLGLGREAVCSVGIRYGPTTSDQIGLLVRVQGAGPGLAEGLATALAERLREYGSEVRQEAVGLPSGPATRLSIVASGDASALLVAAATADAALLTPSEALALALLPLAADPVPGASWRPPSAAPSPEG